MADVTDASFATDVIERSKTVPVVVDLWAQWCGPCKSLGPILEKVIGETQGLVELAKVDVDSNPEVSQAFQVQSIPAVYAMVDGRVVDGFMGAQGEQQVVEFVQRLIDTTADEQASDTSDTSPGDGDGDGEVQASSPEDGVADESAPEAFAVSESSTVDPVPMEAPRRPSPAEGDAIEAQLVELLATVKDDDDARARYLALLDELGAEDPRTNDYRRKLATTLF